MSSELDLYFRPGRYLPSRPVKVGALTVDDSISQLDRTLHHRLDSITRRKSDKKSTDCDESLKFVAANIYRPTNNLGTNISSHNYDLLAFTIHLVLQRTATRS